MYVVNFRKNFILIFIADKYFYDDNVKSKNYSKLKKIIISKLKEDVDKITQNYCDNVSFV